MIETERMMNGPVFQTKIITHTGYRRIIKFRHSDGKIVKDEVTYFKNHAEDCECLV